SRHTSFSRDWSSDVCSSDLGSDLVATAGAYHPDLSAALRSDLYVVSGHYYGRFGLDPKLRKVQGITAMREYPRLTELLLSRGHSSDESRVGEGCTMSTAGYA